MYFGRSERKNGSVQEYVGSTTRTVAIREKEHKREVRKSNSKTWVGKGTTFKVTDVVKKQKAPKVSFLMLFVCSYFFNYTKKCS